ncbi:beclin 1-associated autophagy-related key regulator [Cylas formicarius]|uniref:beclin 1-associated autophagy-related key regulator n=1 Tax=Cylas formicarius TaxID=197179 RepID=UPI002958A41F|nr:beclin 1-associated autophagy-related key regulator [Cylas formicarius]
MASTSEESSCNTAPKLFHLSSSGDSPNVHRCSLCLRFRKSFYCKNCVHSGHICSARTHESYLNIQKVLSELEDNKQNIEKNCQKYLDKKEKHDILHTKIRQSKELNTIIRLALEEKRQKRAVYATMLTGLKEKNHERNEKLKAYKTKSEAIEDCVLRKCEDVTAVQEKLNKKQDDLKKLVRKRVEQLFKYVFPITTVKPVVELESSADNMVQELAEATQTTYISNKWIYTDYSSEMKYSIVAPCIPGSGNYSSYNIWVAQNPDGVPSSNTAVPVEQNPAFSISAALTYTAQLVNVLSFFLNIRLPHKLSYGDFCNIDMNEQQFTRRVARLNSNILYLCISQNIDISSLHPSGTIHNILQLIQNESSDLGRQGPIEVDPLQIGALEQSLCDNLTTSEESDSDEGDSFTVEWEAVPHVQCPEVPAGPATLQSIQMLNTQQASSMAGGLMNSAVASVASIWRGFTGR